MKISSNSGVLRLARDIQDGDELWEVVAAGGIVLEKTISEDDQAILMVSVPAHAMVRTAPRPREITQPGTPFEEVES